MEILSLILWTPVAGILFLLLVPRDHTQLVRLLANFFSALVLSLSSWLVYIYDPNNADLQFNEYLPINPSLGSAYALGIDGLSMPMVVLASLLTSVCLLASWTISSNVKGYHVCVLLLEFGMLGVFLAQDWALFYIFWEVTLIPLFFLIGRWGGKRKHAASLNFVLYTMGGSIFMLLSLLAISRYDLQHTGSLMTSMHQAAKDMPKLEQILVLIGFLIGFGVKIPVFPLHGWLPLAHVEAPSPVSILLSGILLKMGAYGLLRSVAMLPEAAHFLQTFLIILALFSLLYGGLLAWRQTDLKAMVAYASISHMGVVLLGIATFNASGMMGAVIQMTAHGLVAGALFLMVGLLYERTHTRNIQDYSSLVQVMPRFALMMTIALLSAIGLPGSIGFIAELHTIIGGFQQLGWLWLVFCFGFLINAAYAIRTIGLLFTGPIKPQMQRVNDLSSIELTAAGILIVGIVLFGVWPTPVIYLSATAIGQLNNLMQLRT